MSSFDAGSIGAPGRVSKGGVPLGPVPSGPGVGLATPGLTPTPPVSEGAALAQQLAQAVDVTGEAGQAFTFYERDVRRTDRANDDTIKALDRGHAAQMWSEDAGDLTQQIQNGDIRAADGASLDEVAKVVANQKVAGLPDVVQEAYLKLAVPHLANVLREKQKVDQRQYAQDNFDLLGSAASGADDPEQLADLVAAGGKFKSTLGLSDDQIAWGVLGPAAEAAAASGDQAKLDTINGIFGDRFKDKQAQLQARLTSVQNQAQGQAQLDATRTIDGLTLDQPASVTRQAVEQQRQALNDQFPGKNIGDSWALPHIQRLDVLDRSAEAQTRQNAAEQQRQYQKDAENQVSSLIIAGNTDDAIKRIGELAKTIPNGETWALEQSGRVMEWAKRGQADAQRTIEHQWRQDQIQQAADLLSRNGGVFFIPAEGATMERPDGREPLKISYDDLVKGAVDKNFSAIDAAAAQRIAEVQSGTGGDNPAYVASEINRINGETFRQKAKFVSDNGAPWPEATTLLNRGAAVPNLDTLSRVDPKTGKSVIDPATTAGYRTWLGLAGNSEVQQRLTTNPKARLFYENTDLAMRNVTDGDMGKAMQIAYTAMTDPSAWSNSLSDSIRPEKLAQAAAAVGLGGVGNAGYVASNIHDLARLAKSKAFNLGEDDALAWAAQRVQAHTIVLNGYAVPRAGSPVPAVMPDAVRQLVHEWVGANGGEGYEEKDLTMRPGPNQSWVLCDGNGVQVDNHLFQTQDMYKGFMKGMVRDRIERKENYEKGMEELQKVSDIHVPAGMRSAF